MKKVTTLIKEAVKKYPKLKWGTGHVFLKEGKGRNTEYCACAIGMVIIGVKGLDYTRRAYNKGINFYYLWNKLFPKISASDVYSINDGSKDLNETMKRLKEKGL